MLASTSFWMCLAGLFYLALGLFVFRGEIREIRGWKRLIGLGPLFFAASLAAFAPEHFYGGPAYIQSMAPTWVPARVIWPYVVGCALLAAATSLAVGRYVRLASALLGVMFFLFVCMIYLPSLLTHLTNRLSWSITLRDLSFAAGSWSLAGLLFRDDSPRQSKWMILFGRMVMGFATAFFGVLHLVHPEILPGVPLAKPTPDWFPFGTPLAYLTGVILFVSGSALLINKKACVAATAIGLWMTILTLVLYVPILVVASLPAQTLEAINYTADTLLFAGAALLVAGSLAEGAPVSIYARMEQSGAKQAVA